MRCFVTDDDIKVVGDPHLGKAFMNGVPLARRGRTRVPATTSLPSSPQPARGQDPRSSRNLFDRPKVSFETIFFAAEAYREVVQANPQVEFFILAGNHDLSRDSTHVSALQLSKRWSPCPC